jgi:hypothetical protein
MAIYKPLWEYISLADYLRPTTPASEIVRSSLASAWQHVHRVSEGDRIHGKSLCAAPPYLLNRAAPVPDLDQAVVALEGSVGSWNYANGAEPYVKVVVGPPGSDIDFLVTKLARRKGWQTLGPPTPAEILSGGETWLKNVEADPLTPLVILRLGKCYLRHQEGLTLISRLIDWLQSTKRRCLITCDSWAWAFLVSALNIDAVLPIPLTLAPIDGARLQFWLPTLARTNGDQFVFRDAENGQLIFPPVDRYDDRIRQNTKQGHMESYGEWAAVSNYAKQLAAYGRGLPKVVWTLWRECLQVVPESRKRIERELFDADDWYTVWVRPWSQLDLPRMPVAAGTSESILLHTLLLHGGASAELLELLLPLSHSQVRHALHMLMGAGLVENRSGRSWQVSTIGYPVVRQHMENEGFLVDGF